MAAILKFKMATIFKCSHIITLVLIELFDLENIGIYTRIITVCVSEAELYVKIGLTGGHFGKWRICRVRPNIFNGNM